VVSHRVSDSKNVAHPASVSSASKKNVKSITLAERLLLDKRVSDGQRVEVDHRHFHSSNLFSHVHCDGTAFFNPASRHFLFQVHSGNKTMTFTISQDKKGGGRVRPVTDRRFRQRQQPAAGKGS